MNPQRSLDLLKSIMLERQVEMRREAWIAHALHSQTPDGKLRNTQLKQKLALALISAVLAALLIAQLVTVTSGASGSPGF